MILHHLYHLNSTLGRLGNFVLLQATYLSDGVITVLVILRTVGHTSKVPKIDPLSRDTDMILDMEHQPYARYPIIWLGNKLNRAIMSSSFSPRFDPETSIDKSADVVMTKKTARLDVVSKIFFCVYFIITS